MSGLFGTTAGEWEFDGYSGVGIKGGNYGPSYPARRDTICTMVDGEYTENYNKADGRAIAQVPALLELVTAVADWRDAEDLRDMARAIVRELEKKS